MWGGEGGRVGGHRRERGGEGGRGWGRREMGGEEGGRSLRRERVKEVTEEGGWWREERGDEQERWHSRPQVGGAM